MFGITRRHTHRGLIIAAVTLLGCAAAFGQTPAPSAPQARVVSMWGIVLDGIEWPAFLILFGSLAAMALIIEHFVTIRRATIAPAAQVKRARQLIERRQFQQCLALVRKQPTFFATTLAAALRHARHGFDAMHAAATEKSNELTGRLFRKAEYLNILGNLGPLMGLLGTVYGMIKAFAALSQGGGEAGADAGGLASGISLALVNTLLGLILAIIGLGFFGWCRNRIDNLTIHATVQVLDLLEYFRPAAARPVPLEPATQPQPAAAPRPRPVS